MNQAADNVNRTRLLVATALVMLALYAVLSVRGAQSAAGRMSQARDDLAELNHKLAEINRLRQAPRVAALQIESPTEIANRIAAARQAAGLPQAVLLKEQPLEPVRIDRSDFELRATHIDLDATTLPKIITFCEALRDPATGTIVRDLTLRVPEKQGASANQEAWEAQLVLTQMIFSPTSR